MRKLAAVLVIATAMLTPSLSYAAEITIDIKLVSYSGPPAYLAVYVTNPDGTYNTTLWVAGGRPKYYRHLREWLRGIATTNDGIDGITGASVGSGDGLTVKASIADALLDAGYEIHVDSAVENGAEFSSDAAAALNRAGSGAGVAGRGYVSSLAVTL